MQEEIRWTDRVEKDEVLIFYRIKEKRNILRTRKGRRANWIANILHTNCVLKHVVEEKIEEKRR